MTGKRKWRRWGAACHASALLGVVIPFGHIGLPLMVWLLGRSRSAFVRHQGREAVNFQIAATLYFLVAALLGWLSGSHLLTFLLGVFYLANVILAAYRSLKGRRYRYPLSLRIIT